jgi:hypothetical protein
MVVLFGGTIVQGSCSCLYFLEGGVIPRDYEKHWNYLSYPGYRMNTTVPTYLGYIFNIEYIVGG